MYAITQFLDTIFLLFSFLMFHLSLLFLSRHDVAMGSTYIL